jgi:hypothetical protein
MKNKNKNNKTKRNNKKNNNNCNTRKKKLNILKNINIRLLDNVRNQIINPFFMGGSQTSTNEEAMNEEEKKEKYYESIQDLDIVKIKEKFKDVFYKDLIDGLSNVEEKNKTFFELFIDKLIKENEKILETEHDIIDNYIDEQITLSTEKPNKDKDNLKKQLLDYYFGVLMILFISDIYELEIDDSVLGLDGIGDPILITIP